MSSFFTTPASQRKRKRPDNEKSTNPSKRRDTNSFNPRGRGGKATTAPRVQPPQQSEDDDSISGSGSDEEVEGDVVEDTDASSEEDETAGERRIRLAQRYLDRIKGEVDEAGFDAADLDRDNIAHRLKEDVDEAKGRQFRLLANNLDLENVDAINFRADSQSTTGVAVCEPYIYTVSKDKTLVKWQLQRPSLENRTNGSKPKGGVKRKPEQLAYVKGIKIRALSPQQHGHTGAILSVAASPDGRYVATGGADKKLIVWRAEDLSPLKTFYTHRDGVTALDFAPASSNNSGFGTQLFSASMDRSVKTYALASEESLAYVETLFGHQDHVTAISSMSVDQLVSVGARDRSARLWKVVDETQLKFLGDSSRKDEYQTGSIDSIAALPPSHFVTGSDSGALQLWSIHKKKPQFTIQTAHGIDQVPELESITSESDPKVIAELKKVDTRRPQPRAITALVALPGTDVILSGSWDGFIRIWKLSDDKRSMEALGVLGTRVSNDQTLVNGDHGTSRGPIRGIINSLAIFERRKETINEFGGKKSGESQGLCIVAGTGRELRLGRWMKQLKGRNGAIVFEIPLKPAVKGHNG